MTYSKFLSWGMAEPSLQPQVSVSKPGSLSTPFSLKRLLPSLGCPGVLVFPHTLIVSQQSHSPGPTVLSWEQLWAGLGKTVGIQALGEAFPAILPCQVSGNIRQRWRPGPAPSWRMCSHHELSVAGAPDQLSWPNRTFSPVPTKNSGEHRLKPLTAGMESWW